MVKENQFDPMLVEAVKGQLAPLVSVYVVWQEDHWS